MSKSPLFKSSKRILILFVFMLALMLVVSSLSAASEPEVDSYIVIMDLKPLVAYEGDIQGMPATKPGKGGHVNPNSAHARIY